MAWAIEHDHYEVLHVAIQPLRDSFQVGGHGRVEVHDTFPRRSDDNFFHIKIGGVEQSAAFAGGQDYDGVGSSGGAQVSAFERIDGDVHLREEGFGRVGGQADFLADVQHGSFVALAFADDDGAVHLYGVHGFAHGFHGDFIGFVAVAETHGARGGDGGRFDDA